MNNTPEVVPTKTGQFEQQATYFMERAVQMHLLVDELYSVLDKISGPRPTSPEEPPLENCAPAILNTFASAGRSQDEALDRLRHISAELKELI